MSHREIYYHEHWSIQLIFNFEGICVFDIRFSGVVCGSVGERSCGFEGVLWDMLEQQEVRMPVWVARSKCESLTPNVRGFLRNVRRRRVRRSLGEAFWRSRWITGWYSGPCIKSLSVGAGRSWIIQVVRWSCIHLSSKPVLVGKSARAFMRTVNTSLRATKGELETSAAGKSVATRFSAIRTANRHRWTGRVDQGGRENLS